MGFYPARPIGTFHGGAQLWIGSAADAANDPWLAERGFGLVVNCTRHLPCTKLRGVDCVRVAVHDDPSENENMLAALPAATTAVAGALRCGRHVLVHCHAGMQRSATVVAATLYAMGVGDSMRGLMTRIRRLKGETFPPGNPDGSPTFQPALDAWADRVDRSRA